MSVVSDAVDVLFNNLETDELGIVLPIFDDTLAAIEANPAPDNVVAQGLAFEGKVIAALPNIEATAAKDVSTSLKNLLDLEAQQLIAAKAPPAPLAPAPAAPAA